MFINLLMLAFVYVLHLALDAWATIQITLVMAALAVALLGLWRFRHYQRAGTFLATLCLLLVMAPLAFAQDTAVVARSSWLFAVWEILSPIVLVLVTAAAPVIIALLVGLILKAFRFLGVKDQAALMEIEKKSSDALHQALGNGLKFAIADRVGPLGDMITGKVPPELIRAAISYAKSKNPDSTEGVSEKNLIEITLSKAIDVQAAINAGKPAEVADPEPAAKAAKASK